MKQVKFRIVQTILPLLIGMFLSLGAYAQQITVKGHVKDAMGEPVIGAIECSSKFYSVHYIRRLQSSRN